MLLKKNKQTKQTRPTFLFLRNTKHGVSEKNAFSFDLYVVLRVLDIYVALNLLNINGVEEVEETLKTTAFLTLTWMDSELTWSPDMFGNIIEAYWPQVRNVTPNRNE